MYIYFTKSHSVTQHVRFIFTCVWSVSVQAGRSSESKWPVSDADHGVTFEEGYALFKLYKVSLIWKPEKYISQLKMPVAAGRFIECILCPNLLKGHMLEKEHMQWFYHTCETQSSSDFFFFIKSTCAFISYKAIPVKRSIDMGCTRQLSSSMPVLTDTVQLSGAHLFCHVACFFIATIPCVCDGDDYK